MFNFFKALGLLVCWWFINRLGFGVGLDLSGWDSAFLSWDNPGVIGVAGGAWASFNFASRFRLCRVLVSSMRLSDRFLNLFVPENALEAKAVSVTYK